MKKIKNYLDFLFEKKNIEDEENFQDFLPSLKSHSILDLPEIDQEKQRHILQ